MNLVDLFVPEAVDIADLKPHPRNYRSHPDDQLEHLVQSIREHGMYRNVVIARDGTILAGHGVVMAAAQMGAATIPVIRLNIDPDSPTALKVLTGDNEIEHLAEIDDRLLTELLKEIHDVDVAGLVGTGFDEAMLANLVYVTRPKSEIGTVDEAAQWVGLPPVHDNGEGPRASSRLVVNFRNETDRQEFADLLDIKITAKSDTIWWPPMDRNDFSSVRFVEPEPELAADPA